MSLNIGGSGSLKPYAKFNAKADKWFARGPEGEDVEIPRPTFVIDFDNIRTGWLCFREGQAPERSIDPSLDRLAPSPGPDFKRGFVAIAYSPRFFGGCAELASASIHFANAIKEVYAQYEAERAANRGKLPVVACTGSQAMKDRSGVNYRPIFALTRWVDRPAELPDGSPVEESDVWRGELPAARPQASHVPPPQANPGPPQPAPADPLLQAEF